MKYKTLIVGAGNIGAFFDKPNSKEILTHAHAYQEHPGFELAGFFDVDQKKSQKAAKIWGGKSFKNLDEAFANNIDVVSVCVPDEFHYDVLKQIAEKQPKMVFTEKPLTKSLDQAKKIIRLYHFKKIPLLVNYSRRFVPELITLQNEISHGVYGRLISGTGYYGKGIMHNGSHMIDLIRYLISDILSVSKISQENDFYQDDPSISAILKFKNHANIALLHLNCKYFTIFELDLLFTKGRIRITDAGKFIQKYQTSPSAVFKNYKYLSSQKKTETSLDKSIYFAVSNVYDYLEKKQELICNAKEAFLDLKTAMMIKESKSK